MKLIIFCLLFLFFISSCVQKNQFPEKNSERISESKLLLATNITNVQNSKSHVDKDVQSLTEYLNQYKNKNVNFSLSEFESKWQDVLSLNNSENWNEADVVSWVEINGFLLELTGEIKYAEKLEQISIGGSNFIKNEVEPFVLTKRIDHIYVNMFQPMEIGYNHTLGGEVKFSQETDYPKSGSIKLHFGMTERRYIELFIRIPSWADGTMVTVKKVKYFAAPGTYCVIAKKWKEGDLVEVEFPIMLYPGHTEGISASASEDL